MKRKPQVIDIDEKVSRIEFDNSVEVPFSVDILYVDSFIIVARYEIAGIARGHIIRDLTQGNA